MIELIWTEKAQITSADCNCMYWKADWVSTASGSERVRTLKPARYRSRRWPVLSSQYTVH